MQMFPLVMCQSLMNMNHALPPRYISLPQTPLSQKAGLQQERERAEDGTGRKYAVVKECEIEKMSSMQANRKMRNRVQTK